MTRRRTIVLLLAVLAVVGSACGSDNKVGDDSLLNFKEQAGNRLGETTTTTAAPTTTTAAGKATTTTAKPGAKAGVGATTTTGKGGSTATAPNQPTTTVPAQTVREIHIYGDSEAGHDALEPLTQTAFVGSIIRWINNDKVPRSVRADSGQFASPMIAPGASWDYPARTTGEFDYSDDTRPYVTGKLVVSKQ
jgi:plastocyanin